MRFWLLPAPVLALWGVAACDTAVSAGDRSAPALSADRAAELFRDVCIAHLGRSGEMNAAVERTNFGFKPAYVGDRAWGPVWISPHGRITASDHSHHHDGDECQITLRQAVAPSAPAVLAAMRRLEMITGSGQPGELGSTVFDMGERRIMMRYDVPSSATGVTEEDAGLTLLIEQPPVQSAPHVL